MSYIDSRPPTVPVEKYNQITKPAQYTMMFLQEYMEQVAPEGQLRPPKASVYLHRQCLLM